MNDLETYPRPFVCLVRHGQTEAALAGRLNGLGEVPLTAFGEMQAASLKTLLSTVSWDKVLCSPLGRVRRTAELAGFPHPEIVPDLHEFDCGNYEGRTEKEIRAMQPGWDFWRDGCAGGETPATAGNRVDPLVRQLRGQSGAVLVFSHAGTSRILTARYFDLPGHMGSAFGFDPAHGVLGIRGGYPAVMIWNDGNHLPDPHKGPKLQSSLPQ